MHPWFVWIFWIDPLSYAFDALMSTEFHRQLIPCVGPNLVPNGPGYTDPAHQSCAGVAGAIQGETSLTGDQYLSALSYSKSHVWRNFGIVWAWWALFVALTIVATSRWRPSAESGSSLLIPRENAKTVRVTREDEEAQSSEETAVEKDKSDSEKRDGGDNANQDLVRNTSIFTWKDLTYTVKTPSGDRVLLDKVSGWVRPVSHHHNKLLLGYNGRVNND